MENTFSSKEASVADKIKLIVGLTISALETYMKNDPDDVYGLINKELLYDNVTNIVADQIRSNLNM